MGFSLQQQTIPSLTRSPQRDAETIAGHSPISDPWVSAAKNADGQIAWHADVSRRGLIIEGDADLAHLAEEIRVAI